MEKEAKNKFYDINKLPAKPGLLIFLISPSKIHTDQNAEKCFEYLEHFTGEKNCKVTLKQMGLNFIYGDYLYLYSDQKASELRNKLFSTIVSHKNSFAKIIKKAPWYIDSGFSYSTWLQMIFDIKQFFTFFGILKKKYESDPIFKKYVNEDIKSAGKDINENSINFILEEVLGFYLIAKGQARLRNDFVMEKEEWILLCYPGKPLKSEVYLFQNKYFKLDNPKNKYQNSFYDLENKILYDYDKLDLDTF